MLKIYKHSQLKWFYINCTTHFIYTWNRFFYCSDYSLMILIASLAAPWRKLKAFEGNDFHFNQRRLNTNSANQSMLPQKFLTFRSYQRAYFFTHCHIFTRAPEYMGISNLTGKHLKCVKQSAVPDHPLECNCSIDFDHFDILASWRKQNQNFY